MAKFIIKGLIVYFLLFAAYQTFLFSSPQREMIKLLQLQPTVTAFTENFDDIEIIRHLFPADFSRWHSLLWQENTRALRRPVRFCMLDVTQCLLSPSQKNRIEIVSNMSPAGGGKSLKFQAEPFKRQMFGNSRIALRKENFNFKEGDTIYFSAWFYFESHTTDTDDHNNVAFVAFRSPAKGLRTIGEPGRVLYLEEKNYIASDLDNWLPKPELVKQPLVDRISVPKNKWFKLKWEMKLSSKESEGYMRVWMDDKRIISKRTQTLPQKNLPYSILEIGIINNTNEDFKQVLYVDNIRVNKERMEE